MTILDAIIKNKITEVEYRKKNKTVADFLNSPFYSKNCISLKDRLLTSSSGIIAEFKRKSPSKGWIFEHADVMDVVSGYDQAGASGVSVLTDHKFFGGAEEDIASVRPKLSCPILRKDFMIDAYQLYESKAIGADVILLIAAALTIEQTFNLAKKAHELGLEVLLEIHNATELNHVNEYIDMIGVNNRNLKTFEVCLDVSRKLASIIPDQFVKISESGITSPHMVAELREMGFKGFLMGESFMKETHPSIALKNFINKIEPLS